MVPGDQKAHFSSAPIEPEPDPRVTLPQRAQLAVEARAKMARGEKLTPEEQRLVVFALPRKVRRKHKIRTTPVRAELNALRQMGDGAEKPVPGYTGNTAQHQQRYEAGQRLKARAAARAARKTWPDDPVANIADDIAAMKKVIEKP